MVLSELVQGSVHCIQSKSEEKLTLPLDLPASELDVVPEKQENAFPEAEGTSFAPTVFSMSVQKSDSPQLRRVRTTFQTSTIATYNLSRPEGWFRLAVPQRSARRKAKKTLSFLPLLSVPRLQLKSEPLPLSEARNLSRKSLLSSVVFQFFRGAIEPVHRLSAGRSMSLVRIPIFRTPEEKQQSRAVRFPPLRPLKLGLLLSRHSARSLGILPRNKLSILLQLFPLPAENCFAKKDPLTGFAPAAFDFVEKRTRLKGGSGVSSAPTFWPHASCCYCHKCLCHGQKRAINHHCRRSQVLGGTRIFSNFVDAHTCGLRISPVGVADFLTVPPHRPLPRRRIFRRHVVDCLGESLETHSLRSVPRIHHRRVLGGPFDAPPLTPESVGRTNFLLRPRD